MTKTKTIGTIAAFAVLLLTVAIFNLPAYGADKDVTIGKKGEVHLNVPVRAGTTLLQPGMYQIQHVIEGGEHVVIFKEVEMLAGYRHGNTPVSKEVAARINCRVEPVTKKVSNTKITLRTNAVGEKEIADVQIAGEAFKHLF